MTVEIPISADIDLAGLNQKLAQFTRMVNGMGEQIARANRVQFTPISRATLDMARQFETTIQNISRLAPELHRRLKATGQDQAAIGDWQWERLYGDHGQRLRAQRNLFTLATGLDFQARPPAPGQGGGGGYSPPGGGGGSYSPPGGGGFGPGLQGVLSAGGTPGRTLAATMRGAQSGMAANLAQGGSASTGLGAGLMGGMAAGAGFLAVQGISALVSRIMGAIGDAQQETISAADLYRRTGGTGLGRSYAGVLAQSRRASRTLDVGFNEGLGLAEMAARRGNLNDILDLTGAVEQGGGFARGFGFDPGTGVSAFAGLRGVGVTRDNAESQRLGIAIATGIARAGVFARAEDFLAEIATYGETTARASLQQTNLEGFGATLASLVGMRIPGLDVRGAGNLLSQADASLRQGGAAGEASQAFLYRTLGTELGLSPIGAEIMQQGGLFATPNSIFGTDSEGRETVAGRYYRAHGLATPDLNDNRTNLDRVTEALQRRYGNRPELHAHALGRMFGLNYAQSLALMELTPEQRRFVGQNLNLSNEQLSNMRPEAVAQLGRVGAANAGELDAMATELGGRVGRNMLNPDDARSLSQAREAARNGDPAAVQALRELVARLTAQQGAEESEGNQTRRTIVGVANSVQELAGQAVPVLNTMRDALLTIAGRAMGLTGAATEAQLAGERARSSFDQETAGERAGLEADREAAQRSIAEIQARVDAERDPEASRALMAEMRAAQERARAASAGLAELDRRRAARVSEASGAATPARLSGSVTERALAFASMVEEAGGGQISANAAQAFAGNAIRESAMNPAAQGDLTTPGGASVGLLQWRGQRRANFQTMFGIDPAQASAQQQAQFAAWEVTGRVPPGVNPEVANRLPREGAAWRRIQEYVRQNGDTPENWAEGIARFYGRGSLPDRDAAVARRNAATLRGAQATPAPSGLTQASPMPPGAPVNSAANAGQGTAAAPLVVQGTVTGEVTVVNPQREPIAPPAPISGQFGPPRPSGAPAVQPVLPPRTTTPAPAALPPGAPLPSGPPPARMPMTR